MNQVFENKQAFNEIFWNASHPPEGYSFIPRSYYAVALASTNDAEISKFANEYAEALQNAGVNQANTVVEAKWKDFSKPETAESLIESAQGGILLLRDVFDSVVPKKDNSSATGLLCSLFNQRRSFIPEVESPTKPIIVLTGTRSDMTESLRWPVNRLFWQNITQRVGL